MVELTAEDHFSEHSPGRLLHRISRCMLGFAEARFVSAGMSFTQWLALKSVYDKNAATAGELARLLRMTTGAATRLLDVLEGRGLLVRERSVRDRRVVRLTITDDGIREILAAAPVLTASWNEILSDFEDVEYAAFVRALEKLLAAFERSRAICDARGFHVSESLNVPAAPI